MLYSKVSCLVLSKYFLLKPNSVCSLCSRRSFIVVGNSFKRAPPFIYKRSLIFGDRLNVVPSSSVQFLQQQRQKTGDGYTQFNHGRPRITAYQLGLVAFGFVLLIMIVVTAYQENSKWYHQ